MSSSYSANQYESAFKSQRLQNWCETKRLKERPSAQVGHTAFIADDRGHLLPGVVKRGSAWPDFKGTWDLPAGIPAHRINPTARSEEGLNRLRSWGFYPQHTDNSKSPRGSRSKERLRVSKQTDDAPEARPASQSPSEAARATSHSQDSQAAVAGSGDEPVEDKQTTEAAGKDGPQSRRSPAEEEPTLTPAVGEVTPSRPDTGERRSTGAGSAGRASSSGQRHT
ncbi:protein Flattop [Mugil cephalus]|uniref:protein Flattop n=1 Tax=Mugil cephalus TaxID=48193 RepID=UPI001FB8149E|nr:protein Flattop [Mugil cephalus]